MLPWLIKTHYLSVPSFFVALFLAALFSTLVIIREARIAGLDQSQSLDLCLDLIIFAVIGGRLGHILFEAPVYYFHNPSRVIALWAGGFVSYGAILTNVIVFFFVAWRKKLVALRWGDTIAPGVAIAALFVRVGCFCAGCCYGKPAAHGLGLIYTHPDTIARPLGIPLYPTQAIAIIYNLLIFLALILIRRRKSFDGQVILSLFMLYPFCRFFQEFLRGDLDRGVYFGGVLSTAQIISIPLFITSLVLYILKRKNMRILP